MEEWLTSAARSRPEHPALVVGGRTLTYEQLDAAAATTARRVAAVGVAPGDRVATTMPAGLAFAELVHALPRLGAVLVPLDPRAPAAARVRLAISRPPEGREADVELRDSVDPEAVHSVIHTSGTTGAPIPVELSYRNHHASAAGSGEVLGVDLEDRWLCPLPLHHVGGLAVLLRSAIYGTTAILHERFEVERVRAALEAGDVTLVSLVPTMLARLRDAGLTRAPRLRAILLGGGPIPPDLLRWAADAGLPVRATYGMTEAASQIATGEPGEPGARPLPGVELRIGAGEEILARGPMIARGTLAADGWLHTGDTGKLDIQGRLHVQSRLKDLIVTGGENVAPAEVEAVLLEHPAVSDAGVVGKPDPEWGEAVVAYVVASNSTDAEELLDYCRERLAPYKVPKRIARVDRLPRNASGKLVRDQL